MKTTLRYIGFLGRATWNDLLQDHINRLQALTNIESAQVVLERQRDGAPAFRAQVVLVVPGPDYHAAAVDHTLMAAFRKAVENLERQIRARQTQRRIKGKSNLQLGTISRRWSSSLAGHRA